MTPIRPDNAEVAATIIRTAFATIEVALNPAPSALRVTAEDIRAHLGTGGGGALHGTQGCVLWAEKAGGLYIGRLGVQPAARGQGVASALLGEAEREAGRRRLPRLHLEVRLALAGNRRLFARAGFVETVQHAHPGYAHPTYVAAEKWLVPA